jgi:hypothetical protein
MPVLFDSGANCCITPCKDDFVGHYSELTDGPIVDGIGKGLKITGRWKVYSFGETVFLLFTEKKFPCKTY